MSNLIEGHFQLVDILQLREGPICGDVVQPGDDVFVDWKQEEGGTLRTPARVVSCLIRNDGEPYLSIEVFEPPSHFDGMLMFSPEENEIFLLGAGAFTVPARSVVGRCRIFPARDDLEETQENCPDPHSYFCKRSVTYNKKRKYPCFGAISVQKPRRSHMVDPLSLHTDGNLSCMNAYDLR